MQKNYLTYPFKSMKITQSYDGKTSHLPHMTGKPYEYAIDEGGADTGRDWVYCPCDELKIVKISGVGTKTTNTVWFTSTTPVVTPCGTGVVTGYAIHPNDDDLKKLKVGQTFKRGEKMFREGSDNATGNHIHLAIGFGQMSGNGWAANSKGKWVLTITGAHHKPEDMFYIDKSFTRILRDQGLKFKELPKEAVNKTADKKAETKKEEKYTKGNYKVTKAELLNVREGAGKNYAARKFSQLSKSAQSKILALTKNVKKNGYVKGLTFTVTQVKGDWGKTASGWVCLDYCEKI